MTILKSGDAAWFETVRDGLVPCKVLSIDACKPANVMVRVTGDHAAYRRGDEITSTSLHVIPRGAIRRHKFYTTILPFKVMPDV